MRPTSPFVALLGVALAGSPALAQHAPAAPRHEVSEGVSSERRHPLLQDLPRGSLPYAQEQGAFQLTLAPRWVRAGALRALESEVEVEYGVTERWQVGASAAIAVDGREDDVVRERGLTELGGSLLHAWSGVAGFDLSAGVAGSLGFSPPAGRVGTLEVGPALAVARRMARGVTLVGSSALAWRAASSAPHGEVEAERALRVASHAGAVVPVGPLRLTSELSWMADELHGDDADRAYGTVGGVLVLRGGIELVLGASRRLDAAGRGYDAIGKLSLEF